MRSHSEDTTTESVLLQAIEQAPVGLFNSDARGEWTYTNTRCAQMLGLTPAEALGHGWVNAVHPEDSEYVITQWAAAVRAGRAFALEFRFQHLHGSFNWVYGYAVPLHTTTHELLGYVGILEDVTERKDSEQAQLMAQEKLAVWVSELEQRNREIALLNEMGGLLQSCLTAEEAFGIIGQQAPRLFESAAGLLGIVHESRRLIEVAAHWGEAAEKMLPFAPEDCWALRRARVHSVEPGSASPFCRHVSSAETEAYVCLPLLAQGEMLGVWHLRRHPGSGAFPENQQQLAQAVGDSIALALSNLRLRETLRQQSIRDPLTGLFNRRYLEESLTRELSRATRAGQPVSVILLDLDHFKRFNDTFGHAAGDHLLRELAKILQAHIRLSDIACRFGGEEFTLILPEASLEIAQQRAETLRRKVSELRLQYEGQPLGDVTLSLGVAAFPQHGRRNDDLLRSADEALYRAKGGGRNQVQVAPPPSA
jgi:diguanylate cyclase (GGDEF)-like protein/PAS domain S-box-containing protein